MPIYIHGNKVPIRVFSGGEVDVNVKGLFWDKAPWKNISAVIRNSDDLISLFLTVNAIRQIDPDSKIRAHIPYLPYARQDRVCNEGEAFSARSIAQLINSMELDAIYVNVPHSDVMIDLINNCYRIPFRIDFEGIGGCIIMAADEGMSKRLRMEKCGRILHARKKRDTLTGQIKETTFSGDVEGKDIVVVDDICDGGQTFIELAKILKEKGANKLHLYVTFGIFRNGEEELLKYYETVRCQFDFRQEEWSVDQ